MDPLYYGPDTVWMGYVYYGIGMVVFHKIYIRAGSRSSTSSMAPADSLTRMQPEVVAESAGHGATKNEVDDAVANKTCSVSHSSLW